METVMDQRSPGDPQTAWDQASDAAARALTQLGRELGAEAVEEETLVGKAYRLAGEWEKAWSARCRALGMDDNGSWSDPEDGAGPRPAGAEPMVNPHLGQRVQMLLAVIKAGDANYATDYPSVIARHWQEVATAAEAAVRHVETWRDHPVA
jgi:hypothetical protein